MDLIHKTLDWKSVNKNVIKMFEFYVKKTLSHQFFVVQRAIAFIGQIANPLGTLFTVHEHK